MPYLRFTWERRVTSSHGPASPTTRHVLLTFATHADRLGLAFPSIRKLAAETRLNYRTVHTHVHRAVDEGWLERADLHKSGTIVYRLSTPAPVQTLPDPATCTVDSIAQLAPNARAGGTASDGRGAASDDSGNASNGPLVLKHDQHNNVQNMIPNNTENKKDAKRLLHSLREQLKLGVRSMQPSSDKYSGLLQEAPKSVLEDAPVRDVNWWAEKLNIGRSAGEGYAQWMVRVSGAKEEYLRNGGTV